MRYFCPFFGESKPGPGRCQMGKLCKSSYIPRPLKALLEWPGIGGSVGPGDRLARWLSEPFFTGSPGPSCTSKFERHLHLSRCTTRPYSLTKEIPGELPDEFSRSAENRSTAKPCVPWELQSFLRGELAVHGCKGEVIPCDAAEGMALGELSAALGKFPVKACLMSTSVSNPLESPCPSPKKGVIENPWTKGHSADRRRHIWRSAFRRASAIHHRQGLKVGFRD